MLDEQKVRLMARTDLYEQSFNNRTVKLNNRFEKGATRAALLNHVPAGIITFVLIALLAAAVKPDAVLALSDRLGWNLFLILTAVLGVLFVFLYSLYARFMFRRIYENNRGVFWKYNFTREKLKKILETENHAAGSEALK